MSDTTELTAEKLRELLSYEPETGALSWRVAISSRRAVGSAAGYLESTGYRRIVISGKRYRANRLIWLYVYGVWPTHVIDHLNRRRDDNRLCNLRDVPATLNQRNRCRSRNNTSGIAGVHWSAKSRRWTAQARVDGHAHHLGMFDEQSDAAKAVAAFRAQHGFTESHGSIA